MFLSPIQPPKTTDKKSEMDVAGSCHESGSAYSKVMQLLACNVTNPKAFIMYVTNRQFFVGVCGFSGIFFFALYTKQNNSTYSLYVWLRQFWPRSHEQITDGKFLMPPNSKVCSILTPCDVHSVGRIRYQLCSVLILEPCSSQPTKCNTFVTTTKQLKKQNAS